MRTLTLFCSVLFAPLASAQLVFNVGDSITLQSADYLPSMLPGYVVHTSNRNARDTRITARDIVGWMNDPDADTATQSPGTYDIVRWNNGIWDSQPLAGSGGEITSVEDFTANIQTIVSEIRSHSPDALIIYSTSPIIDPNRLTLNPPPANDLLDIETYNAMLVSYREAAFDVLPTLGVILDDKFLFYANHTASEFGLVAAHTNTGSNWHWDGVHFDTAFRQFEAQQTADAILAATVIPGPQSDFDSDGDVDGDDFLIWQAGFLVDDRGDANDDGLTDGNDFLIWQTQFGTSSGSISATVPEPSSCFMVIACMMSPLVWRLLDRPIVS